MYIIPLPGLKKKKKEKKRVSLQFWQQIFQEETQKQKIISPCSALIRLSLGWNVKQHFIN